MTDCIKKHIYRLAARGVMIAMIISLAIVPLPQVAYADTVQEITGIISSTDGASIRKDAGISNEIVTALKDGTEVTVLGSKIDDQGILWYEISCDEFTGYVRYDLIEVDDEAAVPSETQETENTEEGETAVPEDPSAEVPEETLPEEPAVEEDPEVTEEEIPAEEPLMEEDIADDSRTDASASGTYPAMGTVNSGDGAYVRSGAGTGYTSLALWSYGTSITIYGEKTGTDGYVWYEVKVNGTTGYIRSDLVNVITEDTSSGIDPTAMTDAEFENYLKEQGFPQDYITPLMALHKKHPAWLFKAAKTGLNFEDVITKESKPGICVVAGSLPLYYRSKASGDYDASTGTYISHDSGGWYTATPEVIRYYMDPRNFFDDSSIFQFMTHSFDSATQTKAQLTTLVSGTFLSGTYPKVSGESSSYATYVDAVYEAGRLSGVNPCVLASMIIVEQGANGGGASISGTEPGYEGYFNFFNVGAAAGGGRTAVANGLIYASTSGSYNRPWNTRYKSILGGAQFYYAGYVGLKQNTLYFKKFNVLNGINSVATHQYMSNVQGALLEAYRLSRGYEALNTSITFVIPVYNKMPAVRCSLPVDPSSGTSGGATGTVTPSDGVNVRSGAGTSYGVVMSLNGGTVVTVTGSTKGSDGYVWYAISYGGKTGYIRSDLLSVAGTVPGSSGGEPSEGTEPDPEISRTGVVLPASGVNVRSDAGTSFSVVLVLMKGTKVSVTGEMTGTDGYKWYRIEYSGKTGYVRSDMLSVSETMTTSTFEEVERVSGSDRYETALAAADKLKAQLGVTAFKNVVIASGINFPDALAGSYLAKVKEAPVLLANRSKAEEVAEYVRSNMASGGTVYIVGGDGAVPIDVETALKNQGITNIKRIAGANRYSTNLAILKEAGVTGEDILVCSGSGYADSLSASSTGKPILLVGTSLTREQVAYLQSVKANNSGNFYIVGGTGVVGEPVMNEIRNYSRGETVRLAGDTRYTTSSAVAEKFFPGTRNAIVVAYALNFPDGLAGGRVAYAMGAPLILVSDGRCAAAKAYVGAHGVKKCTVIGGSASVTNKAILSI